MITTIVIGFIVGLLARFLMPGKDPAGFIVTTLLGIAGSFIAHYIGMALGLYREEELAGFLMSIIGAVLALYLYNTVFRKKIPV